MKIVINKCFGGFGLSEEAHALIAKRKGWKHACDDYDNDYWYNELGEAVYDDQLERTDPDLIAVVEELQDKADGLHSSLKIVVVPNDVKWFIHEYDGLESVHEEHRVWK